MKFLISYFYQVRFMSPNMIPISTARFDPKWFHNGRDQNYNFLDKNRVLNGLRAEVFAPIDEISSYCRKNCSFKQPCPFLNGYREQLEKLNFESITRRFDKLSEECERVLSIPKESIIFVLLVHEAPDNICSERKIIQDYFQRNGVKLEEFDKNRFF